MDNRILMLILFSIVFFQKIWSQDEGTLVYVDPTTSGSMVYYANKLEDAQDETHEKQSDLKKAQIWAGAQLEKANEIQNKVLKGLSEVSGTLQNCIQVKQIGYEIMSSQKYLTEIGELVKEHPQYSVFGVKAAKEFGEAILKSSSDLTFVLKDGISNMATAGERYRLLMKIHDNISILKIRIIHIDLILQRAIRIGFWRSINPFQGYINTDLDIVQGVMRKFESEL